VCNRASVEDLGVGTVERHLVQCGNEADLILATSAQLGSSRWRGSSIGELRRGKGNVDMREGAQDKGVLLGCY
jgi:hypothetical protein